MAQRGNGFQCDVAASLNRPFVVRFQQDSAQQPEDGGFVGEDAHHIGAPLDLSIEPLDGIVGLDLGPVVFREGGVGLLNGCRQSFLGHASGFQKAQKTRAFTQLGDAKLDCPGPRLLVAATVAVALNKPVG